MLAARARLGAARPCPTPRPSLRTQPSPLVHAPTVSLRATPLQVAPLVAPRRDFAKKVPAAAKNAALPSSKPAKAAATKKAAPKRAKAAAKATQEPQKPSDILANILQQATSRLSEDKKVAPEVKAEGSEPGDGSLPTVIPALVISDYHSYILPGLNRHVEAAPFQQAGIKLDKGRYVAIFLEKKRTGPTEPGKPPATAIQATQNLDTANPIGVIAQASESADGVVLHGICRICQIAVQSGPTELKTQSVNYYVLNDDPYDPSDNEQKENVDAVKALIRQALNLWPRVVPSENWDPGAAPASWADRGLEIFLKIQSFSPDDHDLVQEYINTLDVGKRLRRVRDKLQSLMDYHARTTQQIRQLEEKQIRQQQIRAMNEQLKVLKSGDEKMDEKEQLVAKYNARLKDLIIPAEQLKVIQEEMQKMLSMEGHMSEYTTIRTWLDIVTQLPWGKFSNDSLDIVRAKKTLSEDHYGLSDVKQRILEFIAVSHLKGGVQGKILLFLGPPGVGKTSVGKSIARALGRQFFRFSVGGGYDVSEFKGHRRTYVAALPGKIINGLKQVKTSNPVILIDEIDKLGRGFHGDPMAALLEILDPEQNSTFVDHYVDLPFDLSKVLFLCTANERDPLSQPLQDRMEIIKFSGYTAEEKMHIARGYVIPQVMAACGLKESQLIIEDSALKELIDHYSFEYGVRGLKRCIEQIMRKAARKVVEYLGLGVAPPGAAAATAAAPAAPTTAAAGSADAKTDAKVDQIIAPTTPAPAGSATPTVPSTPAVSANALEQEVEEEKITSLPIIITQENINKYLSRALRQDPKIIPKPLPAGYSLGLAYSGSLSGSVLPIEVVVDRSADSGSHAKLKATGKLGEVLRESGDIAYTFAKNFLKEKLPEYSFFERSALHLHLPQGAISKEGPSAGIALVTALLSLGLNKPIKENLAMTGEVTLLGHVLAIGGVKEKTMGAKSYGIKALIFPHANKADWDELPSYLKAGVEAHFVKHYSEVFDIAFETSTSDPLAPLREKIAADKTMQQQQQQQHHHGDGHRERDDDDGGKEEKKHRERRSQIIVNSAKARMEPVD